MEPQEAVSSPCETPTASLNTAGPSTPTVTPTPTPDKRKRKAAHEYSTNPNTVRVRERNASLTPYQLAVERAKSNDMKAVASAWKERISTPAFQKSSEEERRKILEDVEKSVMDRRQRKKIDASSKIFALNQELKPNDEAVAPRSGLVDTAADRPQPAMAPPGYIPFPTQPIQDLMEGSKKKTASDDVASTSAVASSSSSSENDAVDALLIAELKTTFENLKAQHEAEKLRHESDSIRQVAEMQELRGVVDGLKVQMQHMAALIQSVQVTRAATPIYTPYRYPSTPTPTFQPAAYGYHHYQDRGINGAGAYAGGISGDDGYNGSDGYATDDSHDGFTSPGSAPAGGYVAENAEAWRG